MTMRCIIWS